MKYLPLIFLLSLCCWGCSRKTTEFSGTIYNSDGNVPLAGAKVSLNLYADKKGGGSTLSASDEVLTDTDGKYLVSISESDSYTGVILVKKDSFLSSPIFRVSPGDCAEQDFTLHPFDAYLSVTFENVSDVAQDFYYRYGQGPYGDDWECYNGCGPFTTQPHQQQTHLIRVPGGDNISVVWDTKRMAAGQVTNLNVIACPRHDTTSVIIQF
ncbi:MAG: carboxypeptidase regulatory-like domain-containing protein [Saprospiraceae bacterium]|nr:carboxypeptidase regulatory-like domain-containing protein [Saprospiraceae bacterium]